jgi:molybdate transport system permease protein
VAEHSLSGERSAVARERAERPRGEPWLLLVSVPVLALLLLPLLALVLRLDPARLLANLADEMVVRAVWLSLTTSALTVVIGVIVGTPLAYLLARRSFRGRRVLDTLLDLPMVLPPSVAGIALLMAFGRRGVFGGWLEDAGVSIAFTQAAVVLAQLFVAVPFYVKSASAGFAEVDRDLEQAAAVDGAGPLRAFWHITLPLARTALITGAVLTWARALGEFGATIIFAGNFPGRTQTMPLAIYIGFELDLNIALTLAAILLAVSFGVLFVVKAIFQRGVR